VVYASQCVGLGLSAGGRFGSQGCDLAFCSVMPYSSGLLGSVWWPSVQRSCKRSRSAVPSQACSRPQGCDTRTIPRSTRSAWRGRSTAERLLRLQQLALNSLDSVRVSMRAPNATTLLLALVSRDRLPLRLVARYGGGCR
jgi:hypothetical protein